MRHDPEVQAAVSQFQLGLPRSPVSGRSGELLGRGTGSSLEFQEYREYLPGDDIRHVDWAAYARSDALMVRLYREEISPRTEILLDMSVSMTTGSGTKLLLTRQLAAMFALMAGRLGARPRLYLLGDARPVEALQLAALETLAERPFDARTPMDALLGENQVPLSPQSVRIVISDFLFPHDPAALIRRLAAGAGALWLVQVLDGWEANPQPLGGRRLTDVETGAELNLMVNRKRIDDYKTRLSQLQQELARNCRRGHATLALLSADRGLPTLCRDDLCAAGMLRAG